MAGQMAPGSDAAASGPQSSSANTSLFLQSSANLQTAPVCHSLSVCLSFIPSFSLFIATTGHCYNVWTEKPTTHSSTAQCKENIASPHKEV